MKLASLRAGEPAFRHPRRVPAFNVDKEKSLASMRRIADLLAQHKAALWIHHDKAQSDTRRKAPANYD